MTLYEVIWDNGEQYEDNMTSSLIFTTLEKAKEVKTNIDNYDLGVAIDKIQSFIWDEFCDWYIEIVKTRLYNKEEENANSRKTAQYVLNKVLCDALKLLHPFMPFVTEKFIKNYTTKTKA